VAEEQGGWAGEESADVVWFVHVMFLQVFLRGKLSPLNHWRKSPNFLNRVEMEVETEVVVVVSHQSMNRLTASLMTRRTKWKVTREAVYVSS
jgi:hypothetical protein